MVYQFYIDDEQTVSEKMESWEQLYARDVPPDFEEMRKREDRKERIKPQWDSLV